MDEPLKVREHISKTVKRYNRLSQSRWKDPPHPPAGGGGGGSRMLRGLMLRMKNFFLVF